VDLKIPSIAEMNENDWWAWQYGSKLILMPILTFHIGVRARGAGGLQGKSVFGGQQEKLGQIF